MKGSASKNRVSTVKASGNRRLSREELEIWLTVAHTIVPLGPQRGALRLREPLDQPKSKAEVATPAPAPRRYDVAGYTPPAPPGRGTAQPPSLMPLERRLRQRLSRGRSDVEAVIDLHGMRQAEAHRALRDFLVDAQRRGVKLALVVTGKGSSVGLGHGLERETGVLRQAVPHWLRASDLRAIVVGFEEATPTHGGTGALYVRVRRPNRPH